MSPDAVWYLDEGHTLVRGRALPTLAPIVPVVGPELDDHRLFWVDDDAGISLARYPRRDANTYDAWEAALASAREAATPLDLPPLGVSVSSAHALAARWCRRVENLGVPSSVAGSVVDWVGAPWLQPAPDHPSPLASPLGLPRGTHTVETEAALATIAALDHGSGGWPGAGSVDENLDIMFMWRLARAAAQTRAKA